jgi:hypothetical protein
MMAKLAIMGVGLALALAASPALAKQTDAAGKSTSSTVSPVTVNPPAKPDPLVSPESQFVRSHLPQGVSDQLPRFRDAICVRVIGLPPEFDAFVAKRIVDIANEVHAPVAAAADCVPNVNVIFTPDPQAQLDDIAKRRDILIGFHFTAQTKAFTTVNRPIQAWYVTRTRDTTGNSWIEIANPCSANIAVDHGPCGDRPTGRAGSRLGNDMSAEVVHSLVIADAAKVAGEKIDAVADYIAVLALAKWQGLERCNAIPTILNLMAEGCAEDPPQAATPADLALLTGLYAVDPRELGSQQRMTIASRMAAAKRSAHDR